MKGFDEKFIDELKSKNNLIEVASKYMQLEQRGSNYWARCPFHHEKTPSFSLNAMKQYYHCFGCNKSGDVISLVQELENVDFADAVKILAERAKMKLPEVEYDDEKIQEQKKKKEILLSIMKDTAKYYASMLRSGECSDHVAYAVKRGFSLETLNKFGIGASKDYHSLVNYLKEKGYSLDDCVECGALGKSERNGKVNYYDFLAERFIIPVIDQYDNVVAFSGRILQNKSDVGKYVNTSTSPIFNKSKTFFNLNNLKKVKIDKGISGVIIVEGHLDVVSLVQAGIENVVATMGTAMTKDHARIIKRFTEKVYISYDGDFAGQKATIRGLEILEDEGLEVKVVCLPDGMDPDEVVKKFGANYYLELVKSAMPLIDFKLEVLGRTYDLKTIDGKRKYVSSAIKVIKESNSPTEQEDLLKTVHIKTGVTLDALKRELYNIKEDTPEKIAQNVIPQKTEEGDKFTIASRFILFAFLTKKQTDISILRELEFYNPAQKQIKDYILQKMGDVSLNSIYEITDDKEECNLLTELDFSGGYDLETYFEDCVKTVMSFNINREIEELTAQYSQEQDVEKRAKLSKNIAVLIMKKNKLKD